MNATIAYCLEFLLMISLCTSTKLCSEKLLDDKIKVPDSAFHESSYKDDYRAKWARESTNNDMAWCPKNQISNIKKDYLTIDLGELYVLKMIMTKGLSRHGFITASSYIIEYRRELHTQWREYREKGVEKRIKGNKDHLTEKYDSLDPSIIARWIKIYPLGDTPVRICLILQIYGCTFSNNVLEYKMIDGSPKHNFNDFNYDGENVNGHLSNGLGKLVTFADSKITNPLESEGHNLVGWSQHAVPTNNVVIIFRFNLVRNFTSLRIETSNYFIGDIKTFAKIEIQFSTDGHSYDKNQEISIVIKEDTTNTEMRFITTELKHRIAQYIKIVLYFRSDWIIVRRFEFNSFVSENYPLLKPHSTKDMITVTRRTILPLIENEFFSIPLAYTLVIVISILIIMLIIGIPCVTIFIKRQKNKNKKCKEALQRHFQEEQGRFLTLTRQQHFKDSIGNPGLFTVTNFNPNIPSMTARMIQESSIYTSLGGSDTESNCASEKQQYVTPSFSAMNSCPIVNPGSTNKCQSNDYSATSFLTLGSKGASYMPYYNQSAQLARSQMNLRSHYDMNPISPCQEQYINSTSHDKSMMMYEPKAVCIQGPVGNSKLQSSLTPPDILLVSSLNQLKLTSPCSTKQLDSLKYIKTIGQGRFGSIHIAEWTMEPDMQFSSNKKFVCNKYNSLRESLTSSIETENEHHQVQEKHLASVKVLSKDAPTKIKREFYQEIKFLMSLNHKNFVSILNLEETSLGGCIVVNEHTSLQDAFSYLQCLHLSESANLSNDNCAVGPNGISQSKLLFIASQVASAMKHLEIHEMVHCDLACRNILVMDHHLHIKITDLAISQKKFKSDYVSIKDPTSSQMHKSFSCLLQSQTNVLHSCQNFDATQAVCLLPIRWMPWQALIKGLFTTKSDVYSFGVVLWELLTLCQEQPYQELTNEQVVINSNLQAHDDCRARIICLSKLLSKELSDFITHCTLPDEKKRPSFVEIDMFLQHKTMGCQ